MFASLFKNPAPYLDVLAILCDKKSGLTREKLAESPKFENDGTLTKILDELDECGFIRRYHKIGQEKKDALYQIIDNFVLFHFSFLANKKKTDANFWSKSNNKPLLNSWYGLAFERLCLQHIEQIKNALGISGILTDVASWNTKPQKSKKGAQIDLIIDRDDGVIDICEMKYSKGKFSISKTDYDNIKNKKDVFEHSIKTRKAVQTVLVTSYGSLHNKYYNELVQNEVVLDDLFKL